MWKSVDELFRIRLFAGLLHHLQLLFFGDIFPLGSAEPKGDVVQKGVVEEKRFLLYKADVRSPPFQIDVAKINSSNLDSTGTSVGSEFSLVFLVGLCFFVGILGFLGLLGLLGLLC